jgi:hypothetical protein
VDDNVVKSCGQNARVCLHGFKDSWNDSFS